MFSRKGRNFTIFGVSLVSWLEKCNKNLKHFHFLFNTRFDFSSLSKLWVQLLTIFSILHTYEYVHIRYTVRIKECFWISQIFQKISISRIFFEKTHLTETFVTETPDKCNKMNGPLRFHLDKFDCIWDGNLDFLQRRIDSGIQTFLELNRWSKMRSCVNWAEEERKFAVN